MQPVPIAREAANRLNPGLASFTLPRRSFGGGTIVSAVVWTLCLLAFLALFGWQIWRRLRLLLRAKPADRLDRIPERIKLTLVYAFGQKKFFKGEQPAGLLHACIFWGFVVLLFQVLTMFLRGWAPDAYLPLLSPHALGGPYMLVRDLMEGIVL
ncbi:MAG: hypothetical protein D6815_07220, partial [Candidatus Dadabacteria bacterium]